MTKQSKELPKNSNEENTDPHPDTLAKYGGSPLLAKLGENNDSFIAQHGAQVVRIDKESLAPEDLEKIITELPDEIRTPILDIMERMRPNRKGIVSANERPDFTELRLYQGTGADPNRPDNAIPGQYYLNNKENVGKAFIGTVLAIWEGRTMWGSREAETASRMPVCTSMDRLKGSHYGECATCPNRPWKDGKPQACTNDVMSFMLPKDYGDIILVRLQRTSEPAGRQLMRFVRKSKYLWQKWFKITSEQRTSANDKSIRWYVMQVEPMEGDRVPEELYAFCDAMCTVAERIFIYPGIARIYHQANRVMEDTEELPNAADEEAYGEMDDAESDDDKSDDDKSDM